jgi:uncharacterized damage-inducible protein DinB
MITPEYCRTMAAYNRWQNQSLYGAAETLDADARQADRGAFFKSIHGTLSHLLWGDIFWMSRFDGWDVPAGGIPESSALHGDWAQLCKDRAEADARLLAWAEGLGQADLDGDLSWYSGSRQRDVTMPRAVCVTHMFNHQTHHRGQVHAMLTALGARPDDTDIPFMPDEVPEWP